MVTSRALSSVARVFRSPSRLLLGLLVAGSLALTAAVPAAHADPAGPDAPAVASLAPYSATDQLLNLMNQARAADGEAPLTAMTDIDWVAEDRALDMATHNYFDHFNADGIGAQQWLDAYRIPYNILGENIARTTEPSSYPLASLVPAVHNALMASEHHRENVLDPRFTQVGIAVAVVNGEYYFAIVFTG